MTSEVSARRQPSSKAIDQIRDGVSKKEMSTTKGGEFAVNRLLRRNAMSVLQTSDWSFEDWSSFIDQPRSNLGHQVRSVAGNAAGAGKKEPITLQQTAWDWAIAHIAKNPPPDFKALAAETIPLIFEMVGNPATPLNEHARAILTLAAEGCIDENGTFLGCRPAMPRDASLKRLRDSGVRIGRRTWDATLADLVEREYLKPHEQGRRWKKGEPRRVTIYALASPAFYRKIIKAAQPLESREEKMARLHALAAELGVPIPSNVTGTQSSGQPFASGSRAPARRISLPKKERNSDPTS